jgi:leucyl/phenylalanyl-tRNA--protein transferase
MAIYFLEADDPFPSQDMMDAEGLIAVSETLDIQRLRTAYDSGIFPWYNEGELVQWWCPNPRFVLFPSDLKVSSSMRKILRQDVFDISFNQDFASVISACAAVARKGQSGTWITDEMKACYIQLHQEGRAESVEVWLEGKLVGGLYGVRSGHVFCGESMFSNVSNASKAGFIRWVEHLQLQGVTLIDCQVYTEHLASLGAKEMSRTAFLEWIQNT